MRHPVLLGLLTGSLVFSACEDPGPAPCIEGRSDSCSCDDGHAGARTCLPQGEWGACACTGSLPPSPEEGARNRDDDDGDSRAAPSPPAPAGTDDAEPEATPPALPDPCTGGACDGLPPLPLLQLREVDVHHDTARIALEPVAGARDYRVYELPAAEAVLALEGGEMHVTDAVYRCAGDREAPPLVQDDEAAADWVRGRVASSVYGYERSEAEAVLGYVFPSGGEGLSPVYALGDPAPGSDNGCFHQRYAATRVKRYTASATERQALVAAGWRDDGVAFWVPSDEGGDVAVYEQRSGNDAVLYVPDESAELAARGGPTDAAPLEGWTRSFAVSSSPDAGAVPLMRVHYQNGCGRDHDELLAGEARFERARRQGNQPVWELFWPGLEESTVLVVEALDEGCPFQGHYSARSVPAAGNAQAFVSLEDIAAADPHGEVFINGQHDPAAFPRPVARAFVEVAPGPAPAMDFFDGFAAGDADLVFEQVSRETHSYAHVGLEAPRYFAKFYTLEPGPEDDLWALGSVRGELLVSFADWASDTNGKFRLTPKQSATLADEAFLHASVEVDLVSTHRRYPQILISDQPHPVQENLTSGSTLIVQSFGRWATELQVQVCDHRGWDVNNQCPFAPFVPDGFSQQPWPPSPVVGEHAGVARRARLDVYASTARAYVLLDGKPYGCVDLPAGVMQAGTASVSLGDVLYHSAVDEPVVQPDGGYTFHREHQLTETRRHFDNFGFASGVEAPPWNEAVLPCVSQ